MYFGSGIEVEEKTEFWHGEIWKESPLFGQDTLDINGGKFYFILFHFISFHFISFHFISFYYFFKYLLTGIFEYLFAAFIVIGKMNILSRGDMRLLFILPKN